MTTRTLATLTFPLSDSNKLKLRKEFKQQLGLPKNASEKKLADSLGVNIEDIFRFIQIEDSGKRKSLVTAMVNKADGDQLKLAYKILSVIIR